MTTPTTSHRGLAIAAGAVFLAGSLGILFEDVLIKGAAPTLKHGLTLVILAGTIMAGHLADGALCRRRALAVLGFGAVFLAGTALTVYNSVGRQADTSIRTEAQIEDANERRATLKAARARSEQMLARAEGELAAECRTGKGKRCDGIRATIEVYRAAIAGHDAEIQRLGPVRPAHPEAEMLGAIAAAFGGDGAKVKAAAVLLMPFFLTLFCEFGTIVSWGYGFAFTPRVAAGSTLVARGDSRSESRPPSADTEQTSFAGIAPVALFAGDQPEPVPPRPRKRQRLPANVVTFSGKCPATVAGNHPVVNALATVAGPVTNGELARLMGVTDGEASKRVREVANVLDVRRDGRHVLIALKQQTSAA